MLWFRRDLRLHDHPALLAAVQEARAADDEVVALYVLDPTLHRTSGTPRLAYLARSLAALDEQLDGRLVVRAGPAARVVARTAQEVEATTVHVSAATEPYGRARDDRVERALRARGARLQRTGSPYAVGPGLVLKGDGTPYQVFTPFRSAWLDRGWPAPAPRPGAVRWARLPGDGPPPAPEVPVPLPPAGELAARARWREFLDDRLAGYADGRDRPDLDGTSRLSVPLKWGELHVRTLLADLARPRATPSASAAPTVRDVATYRSQLAWREFHADVLWHHPEARARSLRPVLSDDAWAVGAQAERHFAAWAAGRTGYPLVDAGMRELVRTGFLHNRVRLVVASFLVKDLLLPWQRGAAHFMAHLLDGDVAQNQLNWQWVAGTGRDAAPYFRVFNPVTQGMRFDPAGDYVRRWVEELRGVPGPAVHEPWRLAQPPAGYPGRVVDHAAARQAALTAHRRRGSERPAAGGDGPGSPDPPPPPRAGE